MSKLWPVGTRKRAPRGGFFPEISPFFRDLLRSSFFSFFCRSFFAVFVGVVLLTEQGACCWALSTARCFGHASQRGGQGMNDIRAFCTRASVRYSCCAGKVLCALHSLAFAASGFCSWGVLTLPLQTQVNVCVLRRVQLCSAADVP